MKEEKTCKYFKSAWNWVDITSNLGTLLIITLTIFELEWIPMKTLTLLAAVTSCLLVGKLADWLRLFETTSFYIQLVSQTIADIRPFMILFGFAILLFTIPMILLNLNRSEDASLVTVIFKNAIFDGLLNQYLLSLGEFGSQIENSTG